MTYNKEYKEVNRIDPNPNNRPLSHGNHFESQENKKLCFCTSSLALDERLAVQNLFFQHCVIKVYSCKTRKNFTGFYTEVNPKQDYLGSFHLPTSPPNFPFYLPKSKIYLPWEISNFSCPVMYWIDFPVWFSFADVLKDTVNSLTFLHIRLRQTQLWSEFAIIKRIVYKNGNQHRKQFYFHGLRRVGGFQSQPLVVFKIIKIFLVVFINVTKPVILHKPHPNTTNLTLKVVSFYFKSKLFTYCFRLNNVTFYVWKGC